MDAADDAGRQGNGSHARWLILEFPNCVLHQRREIHRLALEFSLLIPNARILQNRRGQGLHFGDVLANAVPRRIIGQKFQGELETRERGAQLMAQVEHEPLPGMEHFPDAFRHLVEGLGQVPELIRALQGNAVVEIAVPYFQDPLLQPGDGFENPLQAEICSSQNEAHQDQQQDDRSGELEIGPARADLEYELPGGLLEFDQDAAA